MSNNNSNNEQLQGLLNEVAKKLGTNPEQLKKSAQSGDLSESLKNLDPKDAQKIQQVISDKDASSKILSTAKAQELMKKFLGDKQ